MSDARARVLERVRAGLAGISDKRPLPDYPANVAVSQLVAGDPVDRQGRFCARLRAAGGRDFDDARALGVWLVERGATRGYVDPALAPLLAVAFGPAITLETELNRARLDDYQFGVTRAAGAIAETGSLILTEATTVRRLAALAPWIHIAVLDPERIHEHVAEAIAALGDDPNVVWCTGPSKTADVEGILIQGVHGPGEQVALLTSAVR